jgi:predicted Zn-dependent protease
MSLRPLALAAIALLVSACTTTPDGRSQVMMVSDTQVNQMGVTAFEQMKANDKTSTVPARSAYAQCIVDALVRELPPEWQRLPWEAQAFAIAEPNAFALPGGKVGVNTGIFTVARNQDELAAVLGHEIGHVVSHHHDERITRQMNAQIGVSLLGALLGSGYGQLGSEGAGVYLLRNTREQEAEADVVGQRLMADAGFDPSKAVDLWQNMMAAGGARQPQWLSTHPDPENRIRTLRNDAPALMPVYAAARQAGRVPRCR